MGYTNYWYQKESFTKGEWDVLKEVANKLIEPFRNDLDIVEDDENVINLNGVGENSHETFILTKEKRELDDWEKKSDWIVNDYKEKGAFRFCKTNRKPYDIIVWNILLKAYEIAPIKLSISNDDGKQHGSQGYPKHYNKKEI